jgi:hypothetical protein
MSRYGWQPNNGSSGYGEHLGYVYPDDLHQRVGAYVEKIKQLEHTIASSKNKSQP